MKKFLILLFFLRITRIMVYRGHLWDRMFLGEKPMGNLITSETCRGHFEPHICNIDSVSVYKSSYLYN